MDVEPEEAESTFWQKVLCGRYSAISHESLREMKVKTDLKQLETEMESAGRQTRDEAIKSTQKLLS